jgi:hypothetical protein
MMRFTTFLGALVLALISGLSLLGTTSVASAQATRTWVSGVGDDANPCSRTAPCKTFAGAISKTAPAGEINCLDPGGFGAVTITKSIAIKCVGVVGGVLVSGTNGIVVSAQSTDVVYLEGLDFEGINTGLSGVQINTAAKVSVVNCEIRGFTVAGVNVANSSAAVTFAVIDSVISDNPGTGILVKPTGGQNVRGFLNRTRVWNSTGDGVSVNTNAGGGTSKIAVRDSESSNNGGNGFGAFTGGNVNQISLDSTSASNNATGLAASGTNAIVRFTRSTITSNTTGAAQASGGAVTSYITNVVDGNGTPGTFGTTPQE